jgi:hypothetical protein
LLASQEATLFTNDINHANQRVQDVEDWLKRSFTSFIMTWSFAKSACKNYCQTQYICQGNQMCKEAITTFTKLSCTLLDVRSLFQYGRAITLPWLTINIKFQRQPKENDLTNGTMHWKKPFVWADCCTHWWHALGRISNPHVRKSTLSSAFMAQVFNSNEFDSIQPIHKAMFNLSKSKYLKCFQNASNLLILIHQELLVWQWWVDKRKPCNNWWMEI